MKAKEIIRALEKDGWVLDRQKGSHKIFKHASKKGIVVVPDHSKTDISMGTLKSIKKQAGI